MSDARRPVCLVTDAASCGWHGRVGREAGHPVTADTAVAPAVSAQGMDKMQTMRRTTLGTTPLVVGAA